MRLKNKMNIYQKMVQNTQDKFLKAYLMVMVKKFKQMELNILDNSKMDYIMEKVIQLILNKKNPMEIFMKIN